VLVLTSPDIDELSVETLDDVGRQTVGHLQQALDEAKEARAPAALLRALVLALVALAITLWLLWAIARAHQKLIGRLIAAAERTMAKTGVADLETLRGSRLLDFERRIASSVFIALGAVVTYVGVTFILRRFPYTRPWGESMRGFLVTTVANLGTDALGAIPGLFTVLLIALIARFMARLIRVWFDGVERGRVTARWIHPKPRSRRAGC
jgi:hypothetical protein